MTLIFLLCTCFLSSLFSYKSAALEVHHVIDISFVRRVDYCAVIALQQLFMFQRINLFLAQTD